MEIEIAQTTGPRTVRIASLLPARLSQTRCLLAHEFLRRVRDTPFDNDIATALRLLIARRTGAGDRGLTLQRRSHDLANAYRALNRWLSEASIFDMQRLLKDLLQGDVAAEILAAQVGLTGYIDGQIITSEDIVIILKHAIHGSPGLMSRRDVLQLAMRIAEIKLPYAADLPQLRVDVNAENLIEAMLLVRIQELTRQLFHDVTPPPPDATPVKPDAAMQMRLDATRRIAGIFAGLNVAVHHTIIKHVEQTLRSDWFRSRAYGLDADSLSRAIDENAARQLVIPTYPAWAEYNDPTIIDTMVVGGDWPQHVPEPTRELTLQSPAWGDPLIADLTLSVRVEPELILGLVNTYWQLTARLQRASTLYEVVTNGVAQALPLMTANITSTEYLGELATLPREMSGQPIITDELPRSLWPSDTNNWRLLKRGMSSWTSYTMAEAMARVHEDKRVTHAPVVIRGEQALAGVPRLAYLIPYFEVFDALHERSPMDIRTITTLFNMVPEEWDLYLASLRGSIESVGLQALAESFKFVGKLTLKDSGPEGKERTISPSERVWYHTSDVASFTAKEPISLGVRNNTTSGAGVKAEFLLYPFTHLPLSSTPSAILGSLQLVPIREMVMDQPAVIFDVAENKRFKNRGLIPITGWQLGGRDVWDIAAVRTIPERQNAVTFVDGDAAAGPERARKFNAVVRIGPPTPVAEIGETAPLRGRFMIFDTGE